MVLQGDVTRDAVGEGQLRHRRQHERRSAGDDLRGPLLRIKAVLEQPGDEAGPAGRAVVRGDLDADAGAFHVLDAGQEVGRPGAVEERGGGDGHPDVARGVAVGRPA